MPGARTASMPLGPVGVRAMAVALALIAYAGIALVSGFDRLTTIDPGAQGIAGWPYDSFSQRAQALAAAQGNQLDQAVDHARRAVLSDPVDADVIGGVGWFNLLKGDRAAADQAFRISGQLGWRNYFTQVYWLQQALNLGDADVAAKRLDAILRQAPYAPQRDKLIAEVLDSQEGRGALALRIAEMPPWATVFVSQLQGLSPQDLANRSDVVRRAPGTAFDCTDVSHLADALIGAGMTQDAKSVWEHVCANGNELIYDGNFARLDTTAQIRAFDWRLSTRGDVGVLAVDNPDGTRTLGFKVSGPATRAVLQQAVALAPGTYRLSLRMPGVDAGSAQGLRVGLACWADPTAAQPLSRMNNGSDRFGATYVVGNSCDLQRLVFWLVPGPEIQIGAVQLERVAP